MIRNSLRIILRKWRCFSRETTQDQDSSKDRVLMMMIPLILIIIVVQEETKIRITPLIITTILPLKVVIILRNFLILKVIRQIQKK